MIYNKSNTSNLIGVLQLIIAKLICGAQPFILILWTNKRYKND